MRYLKSWLFSVGLLVIIAGVAATYFVQPVETRWGSSGGGAGDLGFFAESADYNYILPIALMLSGLVMMAVAKTRVKPRSSN